MSRTTNQPDQPTKPCATCGRTITWRKKWERDWHTVRYCSDACRRTKPDDIDTALERAILELLAQRPAGATICPSEPARRVGTPETWRTLMDRTRRAANRLAARNIIDITQGSRPVDPSTARGPIRLRLR
ncbi:MAG: DUF3253 domain-containing protein [Phycisphaerales bacterium]